MVGGSVPGKEVKERFDAYFLALGRFMHVFAEVERMMQSVLWIEARVTVDVARAVFSGVRIDAAKSFINRVRETKGLREDPILSRAFAQLTVVESARNQIVHHGAQFIAGEFTSINHMSAHVPDRLKTIPVPPATLDAMTADLGVISASLVAYMMKNALSEPGLEIHGNPNIAISAFQQVADVPWQYTPPPPPRTPKRPPSRPQGHRRPPDA